MQASTLSFLDAVLQVKHIDNDGSYLGFIGGAPKKHPLLWGV